MQLEYKETGHCAGFFVPDYRTTPPAEQTPNNLEPDPISPVEQRMFYPKDMEFMPLRFASISLAALTLLNLAACTHYRYVKPETEQGQRCVAELDARVQACEKLAEERVQGQRATYEGRMVGYRACMQQTPATPQISNPCGSEPVDPGAAQSKICRQNYKESFIDCGGRLEEIKDSQASHPAKGATP